MTARTIRVLEVRYAPTPHGPWGEPEPDSDCSGVADEFCDWEEPVELCAIPPHVGEYFQLRVVPYVPESELERYRPIVELVLENLETLGVCICGFSRELMQPHEACLLVEKGFITNTGEAIK